jgi:transcriptional regulatory protein RtcR
MRKNVIIGIVGAKLDEGYAERRWNRWRPSVALAQHESLPVSRFELLSHGQSSGLARVLKGDIEKLSPRTEVRTTHLDVDDPWDFGQMYGALLDFARAQKFNPERERYLVHITTGTHVAQICLFLLTEARFIPGELIQTSPVRGKQVPEGPVNTAGTYSTVDLDLSRYDAIAKRFRAVRHEGTSLLKSGIETRSKLYNSLIERIERVAAVSREPLLLLGPTGAGKTRLARRIFDLAKSRRRLEGNFVEVNCATIRGDGAMSTLFGHRKGAFTGAIEHRPGLLTSADGGVLFLDEIGELGFDEQAMMLRAVEDKRYLPVGGDKETKSDFQLIAGTNRDLAAAVRTGTFRDDLFARINLWSFTLPSLAERREDIEPNLDYELDRFAEREGTRVTINREARRRFMAFATGDEAAWTGNFRDLAAAVTRMATLAPDGRISEPVVEDEIARLRGAWRGDDSPTGRAELLVRALGEPKAANLDLFDRVQLEAVLEVCAKSRTLSDAGRKLFAASRQEKARVNDADRLRKYLARFELTWGDVGMTE